MNGKKERFQAALYEVPDTMNTAFLYSNNCSDALLAINGYKAFKVITTEERKRKLVIYLEK